MSGETVSLEEVAAIAARAGMPVPAEDLPVLHRGYLGLQTLLARLPPAAGGGPAEPATVFVPPGCGLR